MPLSDIVNVQITRQTQTVQQAGFGLLMILGTFKNFNDLIRQYNSMQDVAQDFSPSQLEYVAAQAVFSQTITPDSIFIGRRQADSATIDVITAMTGKTYTVSINGTNYQLTNSTSTAQQSSVLFSADFVANNLIQLKLNSVNVGTVTSIIDFDINFVSLNSIVATVNGVALSANTFTSDQATTIAAVATKIGTATGVASSTVTGTKQITVVFTDEGNNTIDSVITTLGASQPVATISEGGFFFDTDQLTTMEDLQAALELLPSVSSVEIFDDGLNLNRGLAITTKANQDSILTLVTVKLGASQATPTITTTVQTTTVATIANGLVTLINTGSAVSVTQSIDLVTANSTLVTLNGSPLTPVVFSVDNATTLTAIAALISAQSGIDSAVSNGTDTISIIATTGYPLEVTFFTSLGATQPVWTNIYSNDVNATDNLDGTFTLENTVSGFPYTLNVSTNIVNANSGLVTIKEANPNTAYNITIKGQLIQYTSPTDVQTNNQIATALVALIAAVPNLGVTPTDNLDGSFTLSSDDQTLTFVCQITPVLMTYEFGMIIETLVASESITDSLDNIQAVNDDWYALAIIDRNSGNVQLTAAWIEAQTKLFGTASADPNIIGQPVGTDTTSIAAILNNAGYVRTFVLYHQDADSDYPECAWFGDCLPLQPGSETWAFKLLSSMSYSDLSTNDANNAWNKQCNTYQYVAGFGITQNGVVAQGEYIDIIRGVDWLVSTIQSNVFNVLVNNPKVPYTDAGITSIEAQIRRALTEGVTNNFISADPEYTVTVPKASQVSMADKAARILRNVRFQATLAGAIQAIRINGTVTV